MHAEYLFTSLFNYRACCMSSVWSEDFLPTPVTAGGSIHKKTKGQCTQYTLFSVFLPVNTTYGCFPQVWTLQTDGPLSCGLQGQHASFWGRWEPELSKELPVEVQLHHSDLEPGRHTPGLERPGQDSPLLRRAGSQLPVQHQQPLLQRRTPAQAAGWQSEALQEQVLPCPTHFSGIRGSYRAGDVRPRQALRRQKNTHTIIRAGGPDGERYTADWKLLDLWKQGVQETVRRWRPAQRGGWRYDPSSAWSAAGAGGETLHQTQSDLHVANDSDWLVTANGEQTLHFLSVRCIKNTVLYHHFTFVNCIC